MTIATFKKTALKMLTGPPEEVTFVDGLQLDILKNEKLTTLPNKVGEIVIKGTNVTKGYKNNEKANWINLDEDGAGIFEINKKPTTIEIIHVNNYFDAII